MKRVTSVSPAGQWDQHRAIDRVVLDADERHRRRVALRCENGTQVLLDFADPATLRHGDGLVLDDGAVVEVIGRAESLVEIRAKSRDDLLRLAWHIGNRHTDVQVAGDTLRIRRDHVLEDMLRGLGATVTPVDAPFDPERGAYDKGHAHHGPHTYDHTHDHDH